MNEIFLNYLLKNFLKTFLIFVLVFYCFGVILNLFEDEASKNHGIHTFKFTEEDIVRSELVKFIITKLKSLSK